MVRYQPGFLLALVPAKDDCPRRALEKCSHAERDGELRLFVEEVEQRARVDVIQPSTELVQVLDLL
jgi:hypothetical protein